jgi:hypothetical protein
MVLKNWSSDAKADYPWEKDFVDDFFKGKTNIIEKNDIMLDVIGYFNIDELK